MVKVRTSLVGQTFGRLTVLAQADDHVSPTRSRAAWLCRCSCGQNTVVVGEDLRSGATQSCGCHRRENSALLCKEFRKEATYKSAHARLYRERGKAKYYGCVDCSAPATDWSYDGTDPDEQTELVDFPRGRRGIATFSGKPEHYSPRCRACHIKFDNARTESKGFK